MYTLALHETRSLSRAPLQVEMLLKHGAYDVFKEGKEGESAAKKFCEDDIESILSRAMVRYLMPLSTTLLLLLAPASPFVRAVASGVFFYDT